MSATDRTVALAGALIAVAFLGGCAGNAGSSPTQSNQVNEATPNEATPTEATEPAAFEGVGLPSVAEIEIGAEQTELEIAQNLVATFSDWKMSGANREMFDAQFEGDNIYLGTSEYVSLVTDTLDPIYEEALFGENATNPLFQDAIEFKRLQHDQLLTAHYQTYGSQNEAPYMETQIFLSLESAIEREDGTVAMIINTVREDNGDKNIADGTGTGHRVQAHYTVSKEGGVVKIVAPPQYFTN